MQFCFIDGSPKYTTDYKVPNEQKIDDSAYRYVVALE